ncbi:Acg family FMN-binding oxidoreductase [Spirilliplanes yamanashiensis]|uniref:Nitroreductase n=1 Tax=Spirilliplanes yamanashiensis TaxID=42233 RepID=A0A8J3YFC0_9ACTN|nr:nitroreductase family protein [Spirilliplanes yamanashiensis]MDP9818252.1 nitroreductase [Spirilliplanes yamanashiensis]GIJ06670.1 hypothetical protein Sya03_60220 [Spirilliplanes yamanashiensis]
MTGYDPNQLHQAAAAGIRAPSLHNSQPWLFRLHAGAIEVLLDPARTLRATDPDGWAAHIACGAAVLNARLALAAAGVPAETTLRPDRTEPGLMARLRPGPPRPATYAEESLYAAVPRRHSNRRPFWPTPVPADARAALAAAARAEGAWVELLVGMTALSGVVQIVDAADRVLRRDARYQAELSEWARTDDAPDGVPVRAAGPVAEPHDLLPQRGYGGRVRAPGRDYEPEPLVAVLGTAGDSPVDRLVAGQALQRLLLTATASGLATSMISQPIEVPATREKLRLALRTYGAPQMLVRIGYGQPGSPTPRRPVDDALAAPPRPEGEQS